LGDFFANSSGHSVVKRLCLHRKICFESVWTITGQLRSFLNSSRHHPAVGSEVG
jgi:hypothetical protein